MRRVRAWWGLMALATALAACGTDSPSSPAVPKYRGIRIVSGTSATDMPLATLSTPLVVEVYDSAGVLVPAGTLVRFEAQSRDGIPELHVGALSQLDWFPLAVGTTDAMGRTGAMVRLGWRAGQARVAIVVPTLGLRDTARFTITAGAASAVELEPSEAALFVGRSFALNGRVTDAWRNPRSDPVSYSSEAAGVSVTSSGMVTASAIGRYMVKATAGELMDSSFVSVVPPGTLAAFDIAVGEVVIVELDGNGRARRASAEDGGLGVRPRWMGTTRRVLYSTVVRDTQEIFVSEPDGSTRPFFPARPASISTAGDASPSADGAWVYFSAIGSGCTRPGDYCLHRARADGSGVEALSESRAMPGMTRRPSASPDGRYVAFQFDVAIGPWIKVLDVQDHVVFPWGFPGVSPEWSPNGALIAYTAYNGDVMVLNPEDVTTRVLLTGRGYLASDGIAWSPDSKWILCQRPEGATLVNVQSGERLLVPVLGRAWNMHWR